MEPSTGWQRLARLFRPQAGKTNGYLLTAEAMYRVLERERLRTDRTGDRFSVISFLPAAGAPRERVLAEWSRILQQRLRGSDVAGILPDGRVGVLLPATPLEGGRRLAEQVCSLWALDCPAPAFEVYVYPTAASESLPGVAAVVRAGAGTPPEPKAAETLLLRPLPFWKRTIDILASGLGLVVLLPLCLLIACGVKLTSPGPVFFKQLRSGRGGRPFWLYKFRSMVADAEALKAALLPLNERDGPAFKIEHDPRVTWFGWFIRTTNLDELPQLWNILKGDMSLVGPRPLPCDEALACLDWQRRRLDVTPGLTCIWQATSHRAKIPFADWVRMDLRYVRFRSLKLDFKLVLQTFRTVLGRKKG